MSYIRVLVAPTGRPGAQEQGGYPDLSNTYHTSWRRQEGSSFYHFWTQRRLLFLTGGALQDCCPPPAPSIFPPPRRPCREESLSATTPLLPPHPARAEPLRPWGQCGGRKGGPREGRSGRTASRHKYLRLSSHLLVGLAGEIVLLPHLLLSPKQRERLKPCRCNCHWLQRRIITSSGGDGWTLSARAGLARHRHKWQLKFLKQVVSSGFGHLHRI